MYSLRVKVWVGGWWVRVGRAGLMDMACPLPVEAVVGEGVRINAV